MLALSRRAALAVLFVTAAPALAWAAPPAALSPEDQALVDKAVAYLEGLNQVKGRFTQTDQRGRTATGDFYLKRPGKIRFAYDPPNERLLVSDGSRVSVQDKRLQTFEQYALSLTPLSLFLAKHIRLDRGVRVTKVTPYSDGFSISAVDNGHITPGKVTLVFGDNPMRLKEWSIVDAQGAETRVQLADLTPVASLDPSLFVLRDPRPQVLRNHP